MLKGSKLRSPWLDLAEFRTHTRFYGCTRICKNKEEPIKNGEARVLTRFSPL